MRKVEVSASIDALLRPLLESWLTTFEEACWTFPQTKREWFTEPTLLALLSSASWRVGLPSIVEVKATRADVKNPKLDLLIGLTPKPSASLPIKESNGLAVEAKVEYIPSPRCVRRITHGLRDALEEAKGVSHSQATRYFGLVFAVMERHDPSIDLKTLKATIERVRSDQPDALAWTLLDQPDAVYRGCVLAARETRRGEGLA